jgi:hypothetical protein
MKRNNKHCLPGFPWKGKFTTRNEVDRYFSNDDGIQCLLCGRFLGTLQNHLQIVHGISHEEYPTIDLLNFLRARSPVLHLSVGDVQVNKNFNLKN